VTTLYGFGTGAFGSMPLGTGNAVPSSIDYAEAIAENRIRLSFNTAPKFENLATAGDASHLPLYDLSVVESKDREGNPARTVSVVHVERVDELTVDLILDRQMSSFPARYRLTVQGLVGVDGLPFASQVFEVLAVRRGVTPALFEAVANNRDVANPQTLAALSGIEAVPKDSMLGTFRVDGKGDLASDSGLVSYKKRITRRLTTRRGRFAHLEDYGVGLPSSVKALADIGAREALALEAETQIRREPETVSVTVTVEVPATAPNVAFYHVNAVTRIGQTLRFRLPLPR